MVGAWPWLLALPPLALAAIGLSPRRWGAARPLLLVDAATLAALAALAAAACGALILARQGYAVTSLLGLAGLGASLYLDPLSAVMAGLVALVGAVVIRYSRHYLAGDPRQGAFVRWLALTLAAVLVMMLSGNLALTGLAWLVTGVGLRRLLTFFGQRQGAVLAARKNLIVSRAADLALLAAAILLYRKAGSLQYLVLIGQFTHWRGGPLPSEAVAAASLIALAALLKSAQAPLHGWLLEVMETPTPVSALLHAGVINGGGYIVLRFSGLIDQAPGVLALLAIVGAATAITGSLGMLAQTSVKVSLAWSTMGQIGFMMLECGLGAYAAALLHIVAHSLYKAHAFLSSGSVVETRRAAWTPGAGERPHPGRLTLALMTAVAMTLAVGWLFGADLLRQPGVVVLAVVLIMGLAQLIAGALDARPSLHVLSRAGLLALGVAALYFALQSASERLMAGVLPAPGGLASPMQIGVAVVVIVAFVALTLFQLAAVGHVDGLRWRALHAHVANGFYLNTLANRWLLRVWPASASASRTMR